MTKNKWIELIRCALKKYKTPFFLFSYNPVKDQLKSLNRKIGDIGSNWFSLKTLPLRHLVKWWASQNLGIEVVSEYELRAVLQEGFPPEKIIVNGPGKQSWDINLWTNNLRVNFDSINEIESLASTALNRKWRVGIRFHSSIQKDPENAQFPDQFGIDSSNFRDCKKMLENSNISLNTIHMHLRSNIPNINHYNLALNELESVINNTNITLKCLDLGGGLPAKGEQQKEKSWHSTLNLNDLDKLINCCKRKFPTIEEFIFEYGRFLVSGCGVLVLSVIDVKVIEGQRFVICNGGRTNHALPSDWQDHDIKIIPDRYGKLISTAICGPTCMAYDCLSKRKLPNNIKIGDSIIWFNAGAYHLSWETRFSQPLARVLWHNELNQIIESRPTEDFNEWWGKWR